MHITQGSKPKPPGFFTITFTMDPNNLSTNAPLITHKLRRASNSASSTLKPSNPELIH